MTSKNAKHLKIYIYIKVLKNYVYVGNNIIILISNVSKSIVDVMFLMKCFKYSSNISEEDQ